MILSANASGSDSVNMNSVRGALAGGSTNIGYDSLGRTVMRSSSFATTVVVVDTNGALYSVPASSVTNFNPTNTQNGGTVTINANAQYTPVVWGSYSRNNGDAQVNIANIDAIPDTYTNGNYRGRYLTTDQITAINGVRATGLKNAGVALTGAPATITGGTSTTPTGGGGAPAGGQPAAGTTLSGQDLSDEVAGLSGSASRFDEPTATTSEGYEVYEAAYAGSGNGNDRYIYYVVDPQSGRVFIHESENNLGASGADLSEIDTANLQPFVDEDGNPVFVRDDNGEAVFDRKNTDPFDDDPNDPDDGPTPTERVDRQPGDVPPETVYTGVDIDMDKSYQNDLEFWAPDQFRATVDQSDGTKKAFDIYLDSQADGESNDDYVGSTDFQSDIAPMLDLDSDGNIVQQSQTLIFNHEFDERTEGITWQHGRDQNAVTYTIVPRAVTDNQGNSYNAIIREDATGNRIATIRTEVDGVTTDLQVRQGRNGVIYVKEEGQSWDEARRPTGTELASYESMMEEYDDRRRNQAIAAETQKIEDRASDMTTFDKVYTVLEGAARSARGFDGFSSLFMSEQDRNEWTEKRDAFFADNMLGTQYWAAAMCQNQLDAPNDAVAYYENPSTGRTRVTATVSGERLVTFQYDDFTEYLYKLEFYAVNPRNDYSDDTDEEEYNDLCLDVYLVPGNVPLFDKEFCLKPGEQLSYAGSTGIATYSPNKYKQICIEFNDPPRLVGGSNPLCNNIIISETVPSDLPEPTVTGGNGGAAGQQAAPPQRLEI